MNMTVNTRSVILDALLEINEKNGYTHIVLSDVLNKYQYLPNVDRSFITRTIMGSVERQITIDYILNLFSKVKVNKMKPVIRNILRMSTYQLVYMEGIKDFAVCDEAVKLATKRGFVNLKGFVNGVLRNIARSKATIELPDDLSVKYSTPDWIVKMFIDEFGKDKCEEILQAQYANRPLMIRCNLSKCTSRELAEKLRMQGIKVNEDTILDEALEISEFDYLDKIEEFRNGYFFVQDLSSMLVCHVANVKENDNIIDVCAAPGGKSLHIAEMLNNTGFVDARDVSDKKVSLINQNINRLGLNNVKASVKDARIKDCDSIGKADIVIADLPCSGLGILNKKPDIKYHATMDGCDELSKLQREILSACNEYVKPGGKLVFSTCTINKKENADNVKWFADNYPFEVQNIKELVPKTMHKYIREDGTMQILPDVDNNYDGFFIALLKRK